MKYILTRRCTWFDNSPYILSVPPPPLLRRFLFVCTVYRLRLMLRGLMR